MGRYETLNATTKDLVNCLLPGIAASFEIEDVVDVIPQDIRMRRWDCDRRDHIIDQSEDDPRNWGVQFLKDLVTISRVKHGKLGEFQADLRRKVQMHGPKHPWAKLADIKEIKDLYEAPTRPRETSHSPDLAVALSDGSASADDSYFEELVERETYPKKRRRMPAARREREPYESRHLSTKSNKRHKYGAPVPKRLRRSESTVWERPEKAGHPREGRRSSYREPLYHRDDFVQRHNAGNRPRFADYSDGMDDFAGPPLPTPSVEMSQRAFATQESVRSNVRHQEEDDDLDQFSPQELQCQLDVAEAELRAARLRLKVIEAKRKTGGVSETDSAVTKRYAVGPSNTSTPMIDDGPNNEPHSD